MKVRAVEQFFFWFNVVDTRVGMTVRSKLADTR